MSAISASTGIPRSAISRILRHEWCADFDHERVRPPTARILYAWNRDPDFGTVNGKPAHLKIYGTGPSFETLAKLHARGIPTRALLDELAQVGAIEISRSQVVKLKTNTLKRQKKTRLAIKAFGDTATVALKSMLHATRRVGAIVDQGNDTEANFSAKKDMLIFLRTIVLAGGHGDLRDIKTKIVRTLRQHRAGNAALKTERVELLILMHQYPSKSRNKRQSISRRRNLKRSGD